MIRAVIHPMNEQPLIVELLEMPTAGDASIVCTNVRTLDLKRPKYIDRSGSTFVFPLDSIRFVEVYSTSEGTAEDGPVEVEPEDLEIDEEFLRRVREA
jgi:hypothetical protein